MIKHKKDWIISLVRALYKRRSKKKEADNNNRMAGEETNEESSQWICILEKNR